MSDLAEPFDRYGYRKLDHQHRPYVVRACILCGCEIAAPASRIAHVFGMHAKRCAIATEHERLAYRRTGRW